MSALMSAVMSSRLSRSSLLSSKMSSLEVSPGSVVVGRGCLSHRSGQVTDTDVTAVAGNKPGIVGALFPGFCFFFFGSLLSTKSSAKY